MNIQNLTEKDMEVIVEKTFSQIQDFKSIEDAYQCLVKTMCENFTGSPDDSDIVLSRIYHSFDYALLPDALRTVATESWGNDIQEKSKFIVLMGTYGKEKDWQHRTKSRGHKTILLNRDTIDKIPMVSRLIQQIGFDLGALMGEKTSEVGFQGISGTFGVFYVSPALGSPYIPAQDFVEKYGVKSVIGTGVMLPQGDIGIYIGFSKAIVDNKTAANLTPLMPLFWNRAFPLLNDYGMFS